MPVLVICKFDEDQIKTESFNMETSFSAKQKISLSGK